MKTKRYFLPLAIFLSLALILAAGLTAITFGTNHRSAHAADEEPAETRVYEATLHCTDYDLYMLMPNEYLSDVPTFLWDYNPYLYFSAKYKKTEGTGTFFFGGYFYIGEYVDSYTEEVLTELATTEFTPVKIPFIKDITLYATLSTENLASIDIADYALEYFSFSIDGYMYETASGNSETVSLNNSIYLFPDCTKIQDNKFDTAEENNAFCSVRELAYIPSPAGTDETPCETCGEEECICAEGELCEECGEDPCVCDTAKDPVEEPEPFDFLAWWDTNWKWFAIAGGGLAGVFVLIALFRAAFGKRSRGRYRR